MTIFSHSRLSPALLKLDIDGLRRGIYSDKYFENVVTVLQAAHTHGYRFSGSSPRSSVKELAGGLPIGDIVVEAQIFNRRNPRALVAGVDVALAMLRYCTGHFEGEQFIETWRDLDVEAVEDGVFTRFAGDTEDVDPVIKLRGRYREFALLETTMLGALTRASRIATNVYNVLTAANGKLVLFFPARFDVPDVQALDGYAYWLAVQRFNHDTGHNLNPLRQHRCSGRMVGWSGRWYGTPCPDCVLLGRYRRGDACFCPVCSGGGSPCCPRGL